MSATLTSRLLITSILLITSSWVVKICGQGLIPVNLCPSRTIQAFLGTTGVLEYTSDEICRLELQGFSSERYIGIKLFTDTFFNHIELGGEELSIFKTSPFTIQPIVDQKFVMSTNRETPELKFEYFSNCAVCGEALALFQIRTNLAQSGCISSSFPQIPKGLATCTTSITNIPRGAIATLELIEWYAEPPDAHSLSAEGQPINDTQTMVVVRPQGNHIDVTYTPPNNQSKALFSIIVKVLYCGDIPAIAQANASDVGNIFLVGTKVRYTCNEPGFALSEGSTIECQEDKFKAKWSGYSLTNTCIKLVRCLANDSSIGKMLSESSEEGYYFPNNITFEQECSPGNTKIVSIAHCQRDGTWLTPPECIVATSESMSSQTMVIQTEAATKKNPTTQGNTTGDSETKVTLQQLKPVTATAAQPHAQSITVIGVYLMTGSMLVCL